MKVLKYNVGGKVITASASSTFVAKFSTEQEALVALATKIVPDGASYEIIDHTAIEKPTPTNEDVNVERERRVNLVVPIYLSTGKVFAVDMANGGRANIGDLALMAVIKNDAGIATDFTFRDANDTNQTLTNDEVIEMGMQAAASYDAYYKKSWALKALSPIPQDYEDDSYWI